MTNTTSNEITKILRILVEGVAARERARLLFDAMIGFSTCNPVKGCSVL